MVAYKRMIEKEKEEIKKIKAEISKKGQSMSKSGGSGSGTLTTGANANKNWEEDCTAAAKGFKFIHVIVVSIIFLLLGSYLAKVEVNAATDPATAATIDASGSAMADAGEVK